MMTASEFALIRESLGLSQGQMAEVLGVDRTAVVRYEISAHPREGASRSRRRRAIPDPIAILMRMLARGRVTAADLRTARQEPILPQKVSA